MLKIKDAWLKQVIDERGADCPNCDNSWRALNGREIETCPNCGDEAFDIYEVAGTDNP